MNAGLTYDTLSVDVNEGRKWIQKAQENAELLPDGQAKVERLQEIAEYRYILEQTQADLRKFGDFMRRENLNPRQAYQRLRQRNVRIGDLPDVQQQSGESVQGQGQSQP
jgi:transposase-like protein